MKGNQEVFVTQVSVGSEKNWYFLARQQKFIQGINSPLAPYPPSVILPCYLISNSDRGFLQAEPSPFIH